MEERIAKMMKSLDISREEAIELLAEDEEIDRMSVKDAENDLSEEQKQAAKKARQADRKKTGKVTRERKPNEDKRHLIGMLKTLFEGLKCPVEVSNIERELTFEYNGVKYKIVLSQPRT